MGASHTALKVAQLPLHVFTVHTGQSRRMHRLVAFGIHAVARAADRVSGLPGHQIGAQLRLRLRKSGLICQPCRIRFIAVDNHPTAHRVVANPAQFFAEQVVAARLGGLSPDVGHLTGNEVHLHAELGDREVMQHVG